MVSIKEAAGWFEPSQKVAVITGAGISTDSGIPDFRSSGGLYDRKRQSAIAMEDVLSSRFLEQYPEEFYRLYKENLLYPEARPNDGHIFLKELVDNGMDVTVITQNIDGLHQEAGSRQVLELHGSTRRVRTESGNEVSIKEAREESGRLKVGNEWARPAVTLYGEKLDEQVVHQSIEAVRNADILLVMGTSLNVYPAAGLIHEYSGGKSIMVNKEYTPLDAFFTHRYQGQIHEWIREVTYCRKD